MAQSPTSAALDDGVTVDARVTVDALDDGGGGAVLDVGVTVDALDAGVTVDALDDTVADVAGILCILLL